MKLVDGELKVGQVVILDTTEAGGEVRRYTVEQVHVNGLLKLKPVPMDITIDSVEAILAVTLTPRGIEQWWNARVRSLNRRPREVWKELNGPTEVLQVAKSFAEGSYV